MDYTVAGSDSDPASSPRFQLAAIHSRLLATDTFRLAFATGVLSIACWATTTFSPASIWPTFFGCNAAALLLSATGLRSAYQAADWRRRKAGLAGLPPSTWSRRLRNFMMRPWIAPEADIDLAQNHFDRWSDKITALGVAGVSRLGARAVGMAALAILALLLAFSNLSWSVEALSLGKIGYSISAICLLLAFALLVMERRFAAAKADEWPEAGQLTLLARLPIVTLGLSTFSLLLTTAGYQWPTKVPALLACMSILVASEFLIRAVIAMFSPQDHERQPLLLAESLVVGGLLWPTPTVTASQAEPGSWHGIDLRQIWALTFVRGAFPAVATGIVIVGWLVSGVNEMPMTSRGIYERFGKPIDVVHSGLHIGLPWPFGRIVPVENGIVHELATSVGDETSSSPIDAEGPAPEGANRLWDGTHISEKSQIIASRSDGKQSFQIVNMDVRFVYRTGLSDQAALDAAYQTADIPALMAATASRVLVHDFAGRTLEDVLGEGRFAMAGEISAAIRADLDRLHSGIDVLAVVVEAIHPPAGAANAYHAVQAAEITAQALVARAHGLAAQSANEAQLTADVEQDRATAAARESIAKSDVARLQFEAEQTGYQKSGQVFLTETYFGQLTAGLGHAKALILDHRIGGQLAPTFDLRNMMAPIDLDTAGKASTPAGKEKVNE